MSEHIDPHEAIANALHMLFRRVHQWQQAQPPPSTGGPALERPAYILLTLLSREGPLRPSALAEMVRLDLSTVSRQLTALEEAGWVRRDPDPEDRRAHLVCTTEEGRAVYEANRQRWRHALHAILDDWSEQDLAEFAQLISRFNDALASQTGDGCRCATPNRE